ncbi:hypothetical protein MCHI_000731 [Candidatus Magnetoovum chiemensis]|nr:hypothetical protein MCHI_000731 [Candidatus Magnetoovum chiemensis]
MEDKLILLEDYLFDYKEDVVQILHEAEKNLIDLESGRGVSSSYKDLTYLFNKLKGASFVVGVKWVSNLAVMMDDISVKLLEIEDKDTITQIVDVLFDSFDSIKNHIDGLIEGETIEDDSLFDRMQDVYNNIGAKRQRISQDDVDKLLEDLLG